MKNIIKLSVVSFCVLLLGVSCSKDYLKTEPQNYIETSSVFSDIKGAQAALNGVCRLMTTTYSFSDGGSGEGAMQLYYGNLPGNDFQKCNRTGMSGLINNGYHMLLDSVYDYYPWTYYYRLILNCNMILKNIKNVPVENAAEKDFVVAQALVIRAYSYFRLSELYCNRWADSYGDYEYDVLDETTGKPVKKTYHGYGAVQGVPLRLEPTTGDLACCGLWQLKDQIYEDLDNAIAKFKLCGIDRKPDEYFKPNLNVAYGVYAKAALTYQDWENAAKYAPLARQGFELMTNEEYVNGGFNSANSEWIWGTYDAIDQNLSSRSFFNYMASNGSASNCRTYPSAISKKLYELIPETDVRRGMYLEPTPEECLPENGFDIQTGRSTGILAERAKKEFKNKLYWDEMNGTLLSNVYIYMQFKFQTTHLPGVGCLCIMRAAEMYLIEAEALYNLGGNDTRIWSLLEELNQERNPGYTCDKTGEKLFDEIFLYRRIDLWGEGFDWYDYKRLSKNIDRVDIPSGGSFHDTFKITIDPKGRNKWTWVIPRRETDYNKLVVAVGETEEEIVDD